MSEVVSSSEEHWVGDGNCWWRLVRHRTRLCCFLSCPATSRMLVSCVPHSPCGRFSKPRQRLDSWMFGKTKTLLAYCPMGKVRERVTGNQTIGGAAPFLRTLVYYSCVLEGRFFSRTRHATHLIMHAAPRRRTRGDNHNVLWRDR